MVDLGASFSKQFGPGMLPEAPARNMVQKPTKVNQRNQFEGRFATMFCKTQPKVKPSQKIPPSGQKSPPNKDYLVLSRGVNSHGLPHPSPAGLLLPRASSRPLRLILASTSLCSDAMSRILLNKCTCVLPSSWLNIASRRTLNGVG